MGELNGVLDSLLFGRHLLLGGGASFADLAALALKAIAPLTLPIPSPLSIFKLSSCPSCSNVLCLMLLSFHLLQAELPMSQTFGLHQHLSMSACTTETLKIKRHHVGRCLRVWRIFSLRLSAVFPSFSWSTSLPLLPI